MDKRRFIKASCLNGNDHYRWLKGRARATFVQLDELKHLRVTGARLMRPANSPVTPAGIGNVRPAKFRVRQTS
jgi:hypothetical protein